MPASENLSTIICRLLCAIFGHREVTGQIIGHGRTFIRHYDAELVIVWTGKCPRCRRRVMWDNPDWRYPSRYEWVTA